MCARVHPVCRSNWVPLSMGPHVACLSLFTLLTFSYPLSWPWTLGMDDLNSWGFHIPRRPSPYSSCPNILLQWMILLFASTPPQIHHIFGNHATSHSWRCKPRQVTCYIFHFLTGSHCVALLSVSNINPYILPLVMICCNIFQPQSL